MIQLQVSLTVKKNGKMKFVIDNLHREDASAIEIEGGKALESLFISIIKDVAKTNSYKTTTKRPRENHTRNQILANLEYNQ